MWLISVIVFSFVIKYYGPLICFVLVIFKEIKRFLWTWRSSLFTLSLFLLNLYWNMPFLIISFLNFEFIIGKWILFINLVLIGACLWHISWICFIYFDIPIIILRSSTQLNSGDNSISFNIIQEIFIVKFSKFNIALVFSYIYSRNILYLQ